MEGVCQMQTYRRVSEVQRCQISVLVDMGIRISEISLQLSLHRSTVYRELNRNRSESGRYAPKSAQRFAKARRQTCSRKRVYSNPEAFQILQAALMEQWSPEIISGRLKLSSHQTIYNEIKKHRPHLRPFLYRYNRRSGVKRKSRRPAGEKPAWHKSISERPKIVNTRSRLGDWERDSVLVKDREMILVCLERRSRFVRLEKINKRSFKDVAEKCRRLMTIGKQTPLSITNDNGTEFLDAMRIGIPVYYCDRYSPWQRGSVENVIGRLRRDLTHKTSFEEITPKMLKELEDKLNHRPRRSLGYRTPHEVLYRKRVALGL
jgi:IS30 family transposase